MAVPLGGHGQIWLWREVPVLGPVPVLFLIGSDTRRVHRGARCLLFAIAIELMVVQIGANQCIRSFQYEEIHEKLMLYADDTVLFLGVTANSLGEAMSLIRRFGVGDQLVQVFSHAAGCTSGQRDADGPWGARRLQL